MQPFYRVNTPIHQLLQGANILGHSYNMAKMAKQQNFFVVGFGEAILPRYLFTNLIQVLCEICMWVYYNAWIKEARLGHLFAQNTQNKYFILQNYPLNLVHE